jgi:cephalosporin-C deacetylase-like acetyl esterase
MKWMLAALLAVSVFAQQAGPDPLLRWMDGIAQQQLQQRENAIAGIKTVADAERRKEWVRQTFLSILGGLPNSTAPLNPRVTGHIDAGKYIIEKIVFESLPGFYVTANLYRPNTEGRFPGILLQAGHTQEGKPEGQRLAANLALKRFVVLAFDPIGQGEREQTYDARVDRPLAGWSVPEHIQAGAQNILIGESLARYFIWDAKRAVDYLASRPEVDAERLGAVGCSGGGALTTFIGALDARIKVVAPACFINSYRLLFAGADPDSEMTPPQLLFRGLDMADYVELSAPNPWLILATDGDYFTPAGARMVYEEARRWYGLYGASEKLRFFIGGGGHGTPLETREAIYDWFIRWLKNGKGDASEQPVKLYTSHDLLVTATGHVADLPGSRKLSELIWDEFEAHQKPGSIAELLAELRRLRIPSDHAAPEVRISSESVGSELRRQTIRFESESGVEIGGTLYIPNQGGRKPAVLVVSDKTSNASIPSTAVLTENIGKTGRVVLELEVRDAPGEGNRPFIGNWITNARADQIGGNLPALRAHDILRGIDVLAARQDVEGGSIRAVARGVRGIWLLLAAAADPRIGKIWLDRTPYSLRAALKNSMNTELFDAVIPGFALHWDLDDLRKAMGDRWVLWTDPANWMERIATPAGAFQYRYILGDNTDLSTAQDKAFIEALIR